MAPVRGGPNCLLHLSPGLTDNWAGEEQDDKDVGEIQSQD